MLFDTSYGVLWGSVVTYALFAWLRKRWLGRIATAMAISSWGLLSASLVQRGLMSGHWPLTNRFEVAVCLGWSILALHLLLEATWRERRTGAFVAGMAVLMMTYAMALPGTEKQITPLLPVLRSVWLQLHVTSAVIGYGACGVAAGLAAARLAKRDSAEDEDVQILPPPQHIGRAMERAVAIGFPWLTLGILTGAIWAQLAWGRFWGWDPKETWALITWLWYLLLLHLRSLSKWRGYRLAFLNLVGFAMVLFTFIGVPWLVRVVRLESLHGF